MDSSSSHFSFCFMHFEALCGCLVCVLLGLLYFLSRLFYNYVIFLFDLCIFLILPDINIIISAFSFVEVGIIYLFPSFYFSLPLECLVDSTPLVHVILSTLTVCLLTGSHRQFTFKVIIDMLGPQSCIF